MGQQKSKIYSGFTVDLPIENDDLMGFSWDFHGDLMVIFNGDSMGFNGDLMGFNGDSMDSMGIIPSNYGFQPLNKARKIKQTTHSTHHRGDNSQPSGK